MKLIGVTGFARSGKNLYAEIASNILKQYGKSSRQASLASQLKSDLCEVLNKSVGIDAFTENTAEKNVIRPVLIAYGNMMRDNSDGKYWTSKLESYLENFRDDCDYAFITDIRYNIYPEDEIHWLKSKMNGCLVHVHRTKNLPDNIHEETNDVTIRKYSDVSVEWEDIGTLPHEQLLVNEYLNEHVYESLSNLNIL